MTRNSIQKPILKKSTRENLLGGMRLEGAWGERSLKIRIRVEYRVVDIEGRCSSIVLFICLSQINCRMITATIGKFLNT